MSSQDKPTPLNKSLYNKVLNEARSKFKRFPSLYASSWISREYQSRGGKYKTPVGYKSKQKRWYDEQWVQIIPFVKDGKKIDCGSPNKDTKACRPLKKVSKDTPPTMSEIVKKYGKEKVLKLAGQKNRDMKGRLSWVSGTFKSS
jgi:hypothetical protein